MVPSTSFSVDWLVPFLYEFSDLGIWEMTGEGVAIGGSSWTAADASALVS